MPGGYITRNNANGSYLAPEYDVPEIIPLWCETSFDTLHVVAAVVSIFGASPKGLPTP